MYTYAWDESRFLYAVMDEEGYVVDYLTEEQMKGETQ
jgi:hypothetical protein